MVPMTGNASWSLLFVTLLAFTPCAYVAGARIEDHHATVEYNEGSDYERLGLEEKLQKESNANSSSIPLNNGPHPLCNTPCMADAWEDDRVIKGRIKFFTLLPFEKCGVCVLQSIGTPCPGKYTKLGREDGKKEGDEGFKACCQKRTCCNTGPGATEYQGVTFDKNYLSANECAHCYIMDRGQFACTGKKFGKTESKKVCCTKREQ
mmetsp:Transcript_83140/g.164989  ORF Transcript_83140/g.164989 Transcript_83140/m.164989 type:complete len:206 (-) Transcript_83140:73-690(-)